MPQEHRFFVPLGHLIQEKLTLPLEVSLCRDDSHHIVDVLRLHSGAALTIVDTDSGRVFNASLACTTHPSTAKLLEELPCTQPPAVVETLVFGLSKGKRNDIVCEKATELGVQNLILWQSEHSIVQVKDAQRDKKLERWQKIALSAAKQSQRNSVPKVSLATSLLELLELLAPLTNSKTRKLCGSLRKDAVPLPQSTQANGPTQFVIGPEGDLSDKEQNLLRDQGFELVSLGPFTLRSETAAIVSIAMVEALWGF